MRKKTYAVQAPESVYKMLSEMAETRKVPKMKAIEIMAQAFLDKKKDKTAVILESSPKENTAYTRSPLRIFKNAD